MDRTSVKIVKLDINEEDDFSGVDSIALVESPAIESNWVMFSADVNKELFDSYTDYPDGVKNNAKRGIELNEKVDNKCATQVGKVRAQQLAKGEPISVETIKRMYSYLSRAEVNYDEGDSKACGTISYLLWGGLAGKRWAESKLKELDLFEGDLDVSGLPDYVNEPSGSLVVRDIYDAAEDKEMVDGIVELLIKVEDLDNRKQLVIDTIKDFDEQGTIYDLDDFLERVNVTLSEDFEPQYVNEPSGSLVVKIDERFEDDKETEKHLENYLSGLFDLLGYMDELPVYATPQEAEEVSTIAGCSGYHSHQLGDYVIYMPCMEHEPEWDSVLQEAYEAWLESKMKSWDDLGEDGKSNLLDYLDSVAFDAPKDKFNFIKESDIKAVGKDLGTSYLDTPTTKIRYQYDGPVDDKNRKFCSILMRRYTKQNKVFRKEDINNMSFAGVNEGFGPNGINEYNIFLYRGGNNCRHTWKQVLYTISSDDTWDNTTKEVKSIAELQKIIAPRVPQSALVETPLGIGTEFSKQEFADQQIVAGPFMIPKKLIYRKDDSGEYYVYFSDETIQKIAYKYMQNKYTDSTNLEHQESIGLKDVFVVESWLVADPKRDKSLIYSGGEEYPKGTWYGLMKVKNREIWDNYVKTGFVKGFSVEGFFIDELLNKSDK